MLTDDYHPRDHIKPEFPQQRVPIPGPNGEQIFYELDDELTLMELAREKIDYASARLRDLGTGLGRLVLLARGVAGAALSRSGFLPTMLPGDELSISSQLNVPQEAEGRADIAAHGVKLDPAALDGRAPRRPEPERTDSRDTEHQEVTPDTGVTKPVILRRTLGEWFPASKPLNADGRIVETPTVILDTVLRPRDTPVHAPKRAVGSQWSPADRHKLEPAPPAYIQSEEERQWEAGIGTHTFEQIIAHRQQSLQGQTIESGDWRVVWSTAKRLFLGAVALLTDPPTAELTFEQKQELCFVAHQEVLDALVARRTYLEGEVDLVRSFIGKMSVSLRHDGKDEVVKADFSFSTIREAIGVVVDHLGLRRQQPTNAQRSIWNITKADLTNFLGNTAELREYGIGLAAIHEIAAQAAIARAGIYATHDEQVKMKRALNKRYAV